MTEVRLIDLPVAVHRRATEHLADLRRELDLLQRGDERPEEMPFDLARVAALLEDRLGATGEEVRAAIDRAEERGDDRLTLDLTVTDEVVAAARRLLDTLEQIDELCGRGELLITLATPPEALAYRRWFLGEFLDQAEGREPTPWTGPDAAPTADDHASRTPPNGDRSANDEALPSGWVVDQDDGRAVIRLTGALDLATAPALRSVAGPRASHDLHLDLRDVDFIDSIGLSVVLALHRRLSEEQHRLTLEPSDEVRRVLVLAGVDDLLTDSTTD